MKYVILTGCMGAGKTAAGKKLAARLGVELVDLDDAIEKEAGMSISEMFERFGEAWFREREKDALLNIPEGQTGVLATGGGDLARR